MSDENGNENENKYKITDKQIEHIAQRSYEKGVLDERTRVIGLKESLARATT